MIRLREYCSRRKRARELSVSLEDDGALSARASAGSDCVVAPKKCSCGAVVLWLW